MIRRSLGRLLGHAIEPLLERLERGADIAAQRRLAGEDLRRLEAGEASSWGGEPGHRQLLELCRVFRGQLEDGSHPAEGPAGSRACPPSPEGIAGEDDESAWPLHLCALGEAFSAVERSDEPGACVEGVPLEIASLWLLAGLRSGALAPEAALLGARSLAAGIESRRWFARAGVRLGTANLLRTLLLADTRQEAADGYVDDVCERLLRHVEVRRAEALLLQDAATRPPWQQTLEGLRFALALLDAAEQRHDLRFLNAALKLNERFHPAVARSGDAMPRPRALLRLHYAASLARQEARLRGFAP